MLSTFGGSAKAAGIGSTGDGIEPVIAQFPAQELEHLGTSQVHLLI